MKYSNLSNGQNQFKKIKLHPQHNKLDHKSLNMDVVITESGVEIDSTLKTYIRRRIDFALSRFCSKVERVRVGVTNTGGPLGGIEKLCRIRVQLLGKKIVTVSYSDDNVYTAIANATDQIHRAVARRLELGWKFAGAEPIDRDTMVKRAEK